MTYQDSLRSHLDELKRRHKELDRQVDYLSSHHFVNDEVRRLKTKKLWLKDEIHRIETELGDDNGIT